MRACVRHAIESLHKSKPEAGFQCDDCEVICSTKNKLKVHNHDKHGVGKNTEDNSFRMCSIEGCDFKHLKESFLKAHMTRFHASKELNQCKICPFNCFSPSGMYKHLRTVHTVSTTDRIEAETGDSSDKDFVDLVNTEADLVNPVNVSSIDLFDLVNTSSVESSNAFDNIDMLLGRDYSFENSRLSVEGESVIEKTISFADM